MNTRGLILSALLLLVPLACGASIVVVGPLLYEHEVRAGGSYDGAIVVQNSGDGPQEIKAYQTDYFFWADGRNLYGDPPGNLPRTNAGWIVVAPVRAVIPAGEKVTIRYAIQVPDNAALTGTYWSMVMVEPVDQASPESSTGGSKDIAIGIRQVVRYAVQISTTVGGTGSVQLKFAALRLTAGGGGRNLEIDVENTGERAFRGTVWADLYDANGIQVGKFEAGQKRLYPGTSARFSADITGVAEANYKGLIVVDCEGNNVFGTNVNLVLKP